MQQPCQVLHGAFLCVRSSWIGAIVAVRHPQSVYVSYCAAVRTRASGRGEEPMTYLADLQRRVLVQQIGHSNVTPVRSRMGARYARLVASKTIILWCIGPMMRSLLPWQRMALPMIGRRLQEMQQPIASLSNSSCRWSVDAGTRRAH